MTSRDSDYQISERNVCMINRKRIIDRFNMGMSIFSYYINFNRICNLHDINIEAESFVSDICRILYGWDLK